MTVVLTQDDRRTKLGVLLLDVLATEELSFPSEVSMYPVEDGTQISDHITQEPERLRLGGLISTADVSGGFGIAAAFGFSTDNSSKLIDVIEALRQMHKARAPINISTGQLVYYDMAFSNLEARRSSDGDGGNWLNVSAELVKITKVKLKTADVPAPENTSGEAAGRAGETNKPGGRSTPNSNSSSGNSAAANAQGTTPARDQTAALRVRNNVRGAPTDSFVGSIRETLLGPNRPTAQGIGQ